ncbi:MAG: GNAT family N-acetyltransferase [Phycisphaerae bacterium]|jgi:D-alanine-D-alanine ligase
MTGKPQSVLIVHNIPRAAASGDSAFAESDEGVLAEVQAVSAAMNTLGVPHRIEGVSTLADVRAVLAAAGERIVFNLVESLQGGVDDCNFVPALCRAFAKACTGNDSPALILSLDKWQSKAALQAHGLPTAAAAVIPPGAAIREDQLPPGAIIVKPACTDASEGIDAASVITQRGAALEAAVRRVHDQFHQPALVEQYIDGRELNVSVIHRDGRLQVMPMAEIDFSAFKAGQPRILDYAAKWLSDSFAFNNTPRVIPAPLAPSVASAVRDLALAAWHALGCQDYARVDFRLDGANKPYVLEINPNPDISPDDGFAAALEAGGIGYDHFVAAMLANAEARLTPATVAASPAQGNSVPARLSKSDVEVRPTLPADRAAILRLLAETAFFRDDEIVVAREVLDDALAGVENGHYKSYSAVLEGQAVGWVCFGLTPCTIGTYDIYWIAVAPNMQGKGVGAALMAKAETLIAASGGRLAIIETSGREIYNPTRKFYLKLGYDLAADIPDFYAPADSKVVYTKKLD